MPGEGCHRKQALHVPPHPVQSRPGQPAARLPALQNQVSKLIDQTIELKSNLLGDAVPCCKCDGMYAQGCGNVKNLLEWLIVRASFLQIKHRNSELEGKLRRDIKIQISYDRN